jgi:purine-binding chemotaxis protein CheW
MNQNHDAMAHEETLQIGTFKLGQQIFGTDLLKMREIIRPIEITRIPQAEDFVEGVINLRGVVIPVINLRKRFKMPPMPNNKETRIINIEIDNVVVGFLVDAVWQVYRLPANAIVPPPPVTASIASEYIKGIANTEELMLIILDATKLVSAETLATISDAMR